MKNYFLFIILSFFTLTFHGQTIIPGGNVSGIWYAAQSPFHVQGDIVVNYDSTLIIEPGVEVYFDDSYKLTVNGLLDATGTESDSILFTANNTTTGWQGIEFYQINEDLGVSKLQYCILTYGRKNSGSGGAIFVFESDNVLINHCRIEHNYAYEGGGIFINESGIEIQNCIISHNSAKYYAGGIASIFSVPYLYNLQITHNTSQDAGGILFGYVPNYSYPYLENLTIADNVGGQVGGIWFEEALTLVLDNCKVCYNRGNWCGGIAFDYSGLAYWGPGINSQVYMNRGSGVHDLFYAGEDNTIIYLDTFTVINPDSYHAFPLDKFNFLNGIQHGIIEQADTDLFISDAGSDLNDGLTSQSPLRSFDYALRKITSNAEENNTLWVMPGHYSLSDSDSALPVIIKDNVKIRAIVPGEAVIDGDSISRVFYGNTRCNFTLSGLTIKNGFVDYLFGAHWTSQVCGGGMYIYSSDGIIDSCKFISNSTTNMGGAVYLDGTYDLHFTNCDFIKNAADKVGGGIDAQNYFGDTDAPLELNNCLFSENYSGGIGGGFSSSSDQIAITKCRFIGNTSVGRGAGMYFSDEVPDLVNCSFIGNIAGEEGGGCYFIGGNNPYIINCSFIGNVAGEEGGGCYFIYGNNASIINCTFSDNQAVSGSAVYQTYLEKLYSINTIFWNHSFHHDDLIHVMAANSEDYIRFYTNYSDIQGGENSIVLEGYYAKRYWQEGNITLYPEYTDPENGDYSLNWNSPCVEAGRPDTTGLNLPETDLDGNPRIANDRIDMGAFEYQYGVAIQPSMVFNSDFKVNYDRTLSVINLGFPEDIANKELLIRLISLDGQEVASVVINQGLDHCAIQTGNIATGIYLIVITEQENICFSRKVTVF